MPALSDPLFLATGALALAGAVTVILLAVRSFRSIKGNDDDDDNWNAPPSQ